MPTNPLLCTISLELWKKYQLPTRSVRYVIGDIALTEGAMFNIYSLIEGVISFHSRRRPEDEAIQALTEGAMKR